MKRTIAFKYWHLDILGAGLLFAAICRPVLGYHAPLQATETWIEQFSGGPVVRFRVFDPIQGQFMVGNSSVLHDSTVYVFHQDGVVAYCYGDSLTGWDVRYATYDPARAEWINDGMNLGADGVEMKNSSGVVAWLSTVRSLQRVFAVTYDPSFGDWRTFAYPSGAETLLNENGVVAWLVRDGELIEYYFCVYDHSRADWRLGIIIQEADTGSISIDGTTVTCVADEFTFVRGYDAEVGAWTTEPTEPFASFAVTPNNVVAYTNVWFTDMSIGATSWNWSFGDGTTSSARSPLHSYSVAAGTNFVDVNSTGPVPPYDTWPTAARQIQEAIDCQPPFPACLTVSGPGGSDDATVMLNPPDHRVVLVADGEYPLTNPVFMNKSLTLISVNGATNTIIDGNGISRCLYLTDPNILVDGFSIRNGFSADRGAGVLGIPGGVLRNCRIYGNVSSNEDIAVQNRGGGIFFQEGLIEDCLVYSNSTTTIYGGGGIYLDGAGTIRRCMVYGNLSLGSGGGIRAAGGDIEDCEVYDNTAGWGAGINASPGSSFTRCSIYCNNPGGVWLAGGTLEDCQIYSNAEAAVTIKDGTLRNCLIYGNTHEAISLESEYSYVENCTITENRGGVYVDTDVFDGNVFRNNILYGNVKDSNDFEYTDSEMAAFSCDFSCVIPPPSNGIGNVSTPPRFRNPAAGDFRLEAGSPCINTGTNQTWMSSATDLSGQPRILHGIVDMGAQEWACPISVPADWWIEHGFPTNGEAICENPDGDPLRNWEEYGTDTDPTNVNSCLQMTGASITPAGIQVQWQGGVGAWQYLERRKDLCSTNEPWTVIFTNTPPTPAQMDFVDEEAMNSAWFYRLKAGR